MECKKSNDDISTELDISSVIRKKERKQQCMEYTYETDHHRLINQTVDYKISCQNICKPGRDGCSKRTKQRL